MTKRKKEYLEVHVGDTVTIALDYPGSQRTTPFDVRVLSIDDRGPYSPLINYERVDGLPEPSIFPACDVGFVKKVVVRAPYVFPTEKIVNVFADQRRYSVFTVGGVKYGPLSALIVSALASAGKFSLQYPLDDEKAELLFCRQRKPGLVGFPQEALENIVDLPSLDFVAVRWKVFKKWVHVNAFRLIQTKKENHLRILQVDELMNKEDRLRYEKGFDDF